MDCRNLGGRLGYGAGDKLLIINCDDFGSSHAANLATIRAISKGVATSASLMVPCPWALEAAQMAKGLPVGVHLTLTSEYPSYRWRPMTGRTSLCDRDGFLPGSARAVLDRITAEDALAECSAQVEAALAWGVDVTHLDVHMDVLFFRSDLFEVYLELADDFGLPVRLPLDTSSAAQDLKSRQRADARGLLSSEHLIYPWPRPTRDVFFESIPDLAPGVSEIFTHPVLDGEELRAYDATNTAIRTHDAECLVDAAVSDLLDQHNIKRISYTNLRDLQRASGR
jgi:chitin disaccharide deacetylase